MMQNQPWLGWLAICMCRFVARREWIALQPLPNGPVHECQIGGRIPDELPHPFLAGWRYILYTHGINFTGPDGERLSLWLENGRLRNPQYIDSREFDFWLGSVDQTPERCLKHWLPSEPGCSNRLLELVLEWAEEQGWLEEGLLAGPVQGLYQTLAYTQPEKWPQTGIEADSARRGYYQFLLDLIQARRNSIDTTPFGLPRELIRGALQALPTEHIPDFARTVLEGPIDCVTTGTVIALNIHDDLRSTSEAVVALLPRALDRPELAEAVFNYLLIRSSFLQEVRRGPQGREIQSDNLLPELTLLALEFSPQQALSMVRQCLASVEPGPRLKVSGLLAEIGQDWCIEELDRALSAAPGDRAMTLAREGRWYELEDIDRLLWRRRMQAVARRLLSGGT